jgi:hypothetical protein
MSSRTFEQWVKGIFDHEVTKVAWHWASDADPCLEDDERNVEYLTRLFTECDQVLAGFDDGQVNQGLNFIAHFACSDHSFSITQGKAPWPKRQVCIRSIYDLYAKCFAVRCAKCLSCDTCDNPLNSICFMWWDLFNGRGVTNSATSAEQAAQCLAVLDRSLTLSHPACLQGALHGLGHWQMYFPDRVRLIIDDFLRSRSGLRPELIAYARRAQKGAVE